MMITLLICFFSAQVIFDHVSMILCGISTVESLQQTTGVRSRVLDKSSDVCILKSVTT